MTRTPRNSVFNKVNAFARFRSIDTPHIQRTLRTSHALHARSTRTPYTHTLHVLHARSTRAIHTLHKRNEYATLLCRLPNWEKIIHLFLFQNFKLDSIEVWRQSTNIPGCIFELEFKPNGTSWKKEPCEVCHCEVWCKSLQVLKGFPRCKNLRYFPFASLARARVWVFWHFSFLRSKSCLSLTDSFTNREQWWRSGKSTRLPPV